MPVLDLFSKRQRRLRDEGSLDVYSYDDIPSAFRAQVVHILKGTLGGIPEFHSSIFGTRNAYESIVEALHREHGVFCLIQSRPENALAELWQFLVEEPDAERVLDAIEIAFRVIDGRTRSINFLHKSNSSEHADEAITELNARFQERALGYRFESGRIVRIDSGAIHQECMLPALRLLHDSQYRGAEAEFLAAHQHYRSGRHKEAI